MRLALIAIAVLVLAVPGARAERNPDLAEARAQLQELRFAEAAAALERGLEAGRSSPEELVEIHRLLGEVRASLGRSEAAVESFKRALALAPELDLDEGVSPRITAPFERAKAFYEANRPLAVRHEVTRRPRRLILTVDADPLELVAGGRAIFWTANGQEIEVRGKGTDRIELSVPKEAVSFTAAALDARGSRLVEFGAPDDQIELPDAEVVAPPIPAPGDKPEEGETPTYASWWLWGALSTGFAVAGAGFGLSAQSAVSAIQRRVDDSGNHEFAEVEALEDKARQRALFANISFAVAGACAAASLYLMLQGDGEEDKPERRPKAAVAPAMSGDAVGLSATVRF